MSDLILESVEVQVGKITLVCSGKVEDYKPPPIEYPQLSLIKAIVEPNKGFRSLLIGRQIGETFFTDCKLLKTILVPEYHFVAGMRHLLQPLQYISLSGIPAQIILIKSNYRGVKLRLLDAVGKNLHMKMHIEVQGRLN